MEKQIRIMRILSTALLSITLFAFSSCTEAQKTGKDEAQKATEGLGIINVSTQQFSELIAKGEGIILDVRRPEEIAQGHIEGASFVDIFDTDFEQKINLIQKDKPIYVYCRSGARSSKAAGIMEKNGFGTIYNLKGGMGAWTGAGLAVTKPEGMSDEKAQGLSMDDFNKLLDTELPLLVDFHTKWCAPCRKMAPVIDKLQKEFEGRATVLRVDADNSKDVAKEYQIKGVPVFILFENGKEVWRNMGLMEEEVLRKVINDAIKK